MSYFERFPIVVWNRWGFYQIQTLAALGGTSGFVPPSYVPTYYIYGF